MTGRLTFTSSTCHPAFFAKTSGVKLLQLHSIDRRTFLARRSTRNVVLNAGSKLFIERGFSACGVQDITDAAGVPKGSFYNHFKSKEALAAEVLAEYGKGTTDRSILSNGKLPPLTRLKKHFAALNDHFSQCHDGCLVGKFMAEVSEDTPQIRSELLKVLTLWGEQISAVIAEGQQQGSIRSDLKASELANFLIDSYEGAILRTRVEKTPAALKAFVKVVFSSIAVAVGH
jgi:TetR/AcrR family transcriptional repressor of nem operon